LPDCDPIPLSAQSAAGRLVVPVPRMRRQAVGSGSSVPLITKMGIRGLRVLVAAGGRVHRGSVAAPGTVESVADVQAPGVLQLVSNC
jgi:hypothetical protein